MDTYQPCDRALLETTVVLGVILVSSLHGRLPWLSKMHADCDCCLHLFRSLLILRAPAPSTEMITSHSGDQLFHANHRPLRVRHVLSSLNLVNAEMLRAALFLLRVVQSNEHVVLTHEAKRTWL